MKVSASISLLLAIGITCTIYKQFTEIADSFGL
jgi:hypothetical protein